MRGEPFSKRRALFQESPPRRLRRVRLGILLLPTLLMTRENQKKTLFTPISEGNGTPGGQGQGAASARRLSPPPPRAGPPPSTDAQAAPGSRAAGAGPEDRGLRELA